MKHLPTPLALVAATLLATLSPSHGANPTFAAPVTLELNFPAAPGVIVGRAPGVGDGKSLDFNGNGTRDAIVDENSALNFYPSGTGGSLAPVNWVDEFAVGDFNADGKPDVAVISAGELLIYFNTSTGGSLSWSTPQSFAGSNLAFVAAGDVDGDGDLDVIAGSPFTTSGPEVFWYLNGGAVGSYAFTAGGSVAPPLASMTAFGAGDLEGNATVEVVAVDDDAGIVFFWDGTALAPGPVGATFTHKVSRVRIADVTNDGHPDILSFGTNSDPDPQNGSLFENRTSFCIIRNMTGEDDGFGGTLPPGWIENSSVGTTLTRIGSAPAPLDLPVDGTTADLDGDGKLEVIATVQESATSGRLSIVQHKDSVFEGTTVEYVDIDFQAPFATAQFSTHFPKRVEAADADGDGKLDLLVALYNGDTDARALVKLLNTTGSAGADIAMSVTGPAEAPPNSSLPYTVSVTNNGSNPLTNLEIEAWLPAGTTKVSATSPHSDVFGGPGERAVRWTLAQLAAGATIERTVTISAAAAGTLPISAFSGRVYLRQTGTGQLGSADFPEIVIGNFVPPADSLVVLPEGKKNVPGGRQFTEWKFEAVQKSGATLPGLALKLQASTNGTTWVDVDGGAMSRASAKATKWTLALPLPLAPGTYQFRTVSSATGQLPAAGTPSQSFIVDPRAYLEVTTVAESTDDPTGGTARPGNDIVYRITVTNRGSIAANNVVVYGPVPGDTEFAVAATAGGGTIVPVELKNTKGETVAVAWNIPSLAPGASITVNYACEVPDDIKLGTKVTAQGFGAAHGGSPATDLKSFAGAIALAAKAKNVTLANPPVTGVVSGLSLVIASDAPIAPVGSTITYTLSVQNLYRSARPECVVSVRLPLGLAFESYRVQNGINFNGAVSTSISSGTNPALVRPSFDTPGVITWNLGTMAARENRTLIFTARVGADLPDTVLNPLGGTSPNEVALREYNFRSGGGRNPFYAFPHPTLKDTEPLDVKLLAQPPVRSLLTVPALAGLPQIGVSKEVIGENDGFLNVGGFELPSVTSDGGFFTEITVKNTGGVTARNCRVVEAIAPQVVFDTSVTLDGAPQNLSQFDLFDLKLKQITQAEITGDSRRFFQTQYVMFNIGDVAAGATKVIRYRTRAATLASRDSTKPAKDPTPLKVGTKFPNLAPSVFSDSFALSIPARNTDPAGIVVTPVSLAVEIYPSQPRASAGEQFAFDTVIRNNGGGTATGIGYAGDIPAGATFVGAQFIDSLTGAETGVPTVTRTPAAGETKRIAFAVPPVGGDSSLIVRVTLALKAAAQLPAAFAKPGTGVVFESEVIYRPTASPAPAAQFAQAAAPAAAVQGPATKPALSASFVQYQAGPTLPRLFVLRQAPLSVREGDALIYTIVAGNHGGSAITGAEVAILIPAGCDLVTSGLMVTTPGFKKSGTKISWPLGDIAAHSAVARALVVRPKPGFARKDNLLVENSCVGAGSNVPDIAPGPTSTLILNTNPIAGAFQSFGAWLSGFGSRGVSSSNNALAQRISQFTNNTMVTSVGGADLIANDGGSVIIPLGGGNVVASGGGNVIAAGGGNIIAAGGGNVVASGGGNIIASGAGNLIANDGAALTSANIAQLAQNIRAGLVGGSVVAAGGGNLIANDGAGLIANDGAGLAGSIGFQAGGIIAAGGGNIIAAGGGNVVAAGGGNVIAAGGGNIVSGGAGNLRPNPGSGAQSIHVTNGGGIIAAGAGNVIASGGGNAVAGAGGGILASGGGNVVAGGAGN